jgi:hypothetical protein
MSPPPASPAAERSTFRALWKARPARHRRAVWALVLALDVLPWPWGEDIAARLFTVAGVMRRRSRWRRAVAWASRQPGRRPGPLALALCAFRGRWVARSVLLGLRAPKDLLRHVVVRGAEHLAASGSSILLGFHVGPPNADVVLRALGHKLVWLGGARVSRGWSRTAWRPFVDPSEHLSAEGRQVFWAAALYRARRVLLDGGRLFIMADSSPGPAVFHLPLPGGPMIINEGWLSLHRQTGARVVPVLTHLAGRTQVITIHPPLPQSGAEPVGEVGAWREILGRLLNEYVRRFPEQCPGRVFAGPLGKAAIAGGGPPQRQADAAGTRPPAGAR